MHSWTERYGGQYCTRCDRLVCLHPAIDPSEINRIAGPCQKVTEEELIEGLTQATSGSISNLLGAAHADVQPPAGHPQIFRGLLGPGSELKKLLRRFFIKSKQGCGCDQRAMLMDEQGPDWCIDHLEEIVEWLREAATERHLPFTAIGARILIRRAISNSRKKLKAVKE